MSSNNNTAAKSKKRSIQESKESDVTKSHSGEPDKKKRKTEKNNSNNKKEDGKVKIICYNLNGVRAASKKNLKEYIEEENADIMCFSEMKAEEKDCPISFKELGYNVFWNACSVKKGYSGTCIIVKNNIPNVNLYDTKKYIKDEEGRIICLNINDKYILINTYVPNSGDKLKFKSKRLEWDKNMFNLLNDLNKEKKFKGIIWTGDLNVAKNDWDVYDGETNKNRKKTPGFTDYERNNFKNLLKELKLIDSFDKMYPDKKKKNFTFFSARGKNMKDQNKGWRLDYFVTNDNIYKLINDIQVQKARKCSDHVPLVLTLKDPNVYL